MTLVNRVLSTLLGTLLLPWTAFTALNAASIPREQVEADGNREHLCLALSMFQSTRDKANRARVPHPWMMNERYIHLQEVLDGYKKTGVPLLGLDGKDLVPAARTDDSGLFYFAPPIIRYFHLSMAEGTQLFLEGLLTLGVGAGLIGYWFLFNGWLNRSVVFLGLFLLWLFSYKVKDVYVVQAAVAAGTIPWFLYLSKKASSRRMFFGFLLLAGIAIGTANMIRAQAGTAVLLFMGAVLLFSSQLSQKTRLVGLTLLLCGASVPHLYFHTLIVRRDVYLADHQPGYMPARDIHPFWHPTYLGLAYLSNRYVPAYLDEVAVEKVCSAAPNVPYVSDEYERILRREVVALIKDHPTFAVLTFAAKTGVVFLFLLLGANLGLVAAVVHPKPWWIEVGFACAMAFSALSGILVMPIRQYLLGFFTFAVLYGVLSICYAIQSGALSRQVQIAHNLLAKKLNARIVSSAVLLPQCSSTDRLVAGAKPKGEAHRFEESTSGKRSRPV